MTFGWHLTSFGGLAVVPWKVGDPLPDTATAMPRIAAELDSRDDWPDLLRAYLALPGAPATQGLTIGTWQEMYDTPPDAVIDALIEAAMPGLRVLFFGDVTVEECEVSWLQNGDQSRLYAAYPNLDSLAIRGGNSLRLPGLALPRLLGLVIETGGMSVETVRDVLSADLPSLTQLQLYLGTEDYGASSSVGDLEPLLSGRIFPNLRYLGLQNCEYADDIAAALVDAPILDRLEVLDLSLGTLTDAGARSLASAPGVRRLRHLNLEHHFLSDDGMALIRSLGVDVDLSGQHEDGEYRYVAIGE